MHVYPIFEIKIGQFQDIQNLLHESVFFVKIQPCHIQIPWPIYMYVYMY